MDTKERVRRVIELSGPTGISGFDIGQICGLWSWRLYPALHSLERSGLVCSEFYETAAPRHRRYYMPYYGLPQHYGTVGGPAPDGVIVVGFGGNNAHG